MSAEEIKEKIAKLENDIFMEEMKDSGYRSDHVRKKEDEIKELEEQLKAIEMNR